MIADALRLAKEATNGWACYAKRKIELDEIARLHQAIRDLEALAALRTERGAQEPPPFDEWAERLTANRETFGPDNFTALITGHLENAYNAGLAARAPHPERTELATVTCPRCSAVLVHPEPSVWTRPVRCVGCQLSFYPLSRETR